MAAFLDSVQTAHKVFSVDELNSSRADIICTAPKLSNPFLGHFPIIDRRNEICKLVTIFVIELLIALGNLAKFFEYGLKGWLVQHCFSFQRFSVGWQVSKTWRNDSTFISVQTDC
jgi:hypothetical protein